MTAAIQAVLVLITQLLPTILSAGNAGTATTIITALSNMLPFILQEIGSLYGPVKNIIQALSADPGTTAEELATLQQLDAQVDAAFEQIAAQTDADAKAADATDAPPTAPPTA